MQLSSTTVYIHCDFWLHKSNEFKRCVMRHLSRLETVVLFAQDEEVRSFVEVRRWLGL